MTAGGKGARRDREPCVDGRPNSPLIDELCLLVGRIVSTDQEVANKLEMCAEVGGRRQGSETRHINGTGVQTPPDIESISRSIHARKHKRSTKKGVMDLEFYWEEVMVVDQTAVSFEEFASNVEKSHNERNVIAHGAVSFREGAIKNVRMGKAYARDDLVDRLRLATCALRDINKIYVHFGLIDYDAYLESVQAD